MFVRVDAAHHVVRGGRDGDVFRFDVDAVFLARPRDHREDVRSVVDDGRVEPDVVAARVLHLLEDAAGDDVARRELGHRMIAGHETLAFHVAQQRPRAAHGLGNEEVRAAIERECRRVELHELHVHDVRARAPRERHAAARRALGVRRLAVKASRAARCEDCCGRAQHDLFAIQQRDRAVAAAVFRQEVDDVAVLERLDVRFLRDDRVQRARDLRARRIAMRVHDAVAAVAAFAAECELAVCRAVELCAVFRELRDVVRALRHDDARDIAIRQPRARDERVLEVELRIVIVAKGRRDAALRLVRVAVGERVAHGEQHALARLREPPGRRQPRHARADDERVGLIRREIPRIEIHQVTLHVCSYFLLPNK